MDNITHCFLNIHLYSYVRYPFNENKDIVYETLLSESPGTDIISQAVYEFPMYFCTEKVL
jgi:hypothetical protein